MSKENSPPPSPMTPSHNRRASVMPGTKLSELLGKSPAGTNAYPGPIAAAAQAQRRRMSISTLGLSGSPTQTSPFGSFKARQGSVSSNGSGSPTHNNEESAVDDGDATSPLSASPFARRMSFGARAMRDVRAGSNGFNGRSSIHKTATSPPSAGRGLSSSSGTALAPERDAASTVASARAPSNSLSRRTGEGFNVSESLRSKAERSSSFSNPFSSSSAPFAQRDAPQPRAQPAATPPKPVARPQAAPDHFQERILKGEFLAD